MGVLVSVLNEPVGNKKFLNTDATMSAIVSVVISRFDYHNRFLCGFTDELKCRLQKLQNNADRVVSGSKRYDYITPILRNLHWLPIRKRIKFKILLFTFKCMKRCAPLFFRESLVNKANTRFCDRAFCAYAPRLWYELHDNIRAADGVQNVITQLKTLLFRRVYLTIWTINIVPLAILYIAHLNIIGGKGTTVYQISITT